MLINLKKSSYSVVLSAIIFSLLFSGVNQAKESESSDKAIVEIHSKITALFPRLGEITVEASPVKNVYQFWTGNTLNHVSYMDGHLFFGELYDEKRQVSLAEEAKEGRTLELISALKDEDTINFGDKNAKRTISVFTDVDCFYCRKLHAEVKELTDAGIKVRYVAFPAYKKDMKKHTSVWCADDQQKAMTMAKSGQAIPEKTCDTPIMKTFELGAALGFRGTPQIIYDDGTIVGGYRPAAEIISDLGLSKKAG